MELFEAIRDIGKNQFFFSNSIGLIEIDEAIFYICQIILQLEYLHTH